MNTNLDIEREYDDERFNPRVVYEDDYQKVIMAFFDEGQFIPVHAPESTLTVVVQSGSGVVRKGDEEHPVEPGDVVTVPANVERGVRASPDERLEAVMVTSPPPSEEDHRKVREGLRNDEFEP
ncbi:MAG: cupin domain-containing protein [Halobacteria archaeon]|nr:cupin domain-containing protein [Halobacteria archaeon]